MSHIHSKRRSPKKRRGVAVAATLSLGALTILGPGPLERLSTAHAAAAQAARSISLNDSGRLHLTSKHGFTLNEQGTATGTVAGTIFVHLTIVSTKRVTAEVNIYPHGGSITGKATASYRRGGATGSFSGSMSISRGSGSYARSQGTGLSFSGTIQRSNDAVTVHVDGTVTE